MKAIVEKDLIISIGNSGSIHVPQELQELPIHQMRFNGESVIDAKSEHVFYICHSGVKHVIKYDKLWQRIECKFDDVLVRDGSMWRKENSRDVFENRLIAVDKIRRQLYLEVSDPLYMEAWRKESKGLGDEAAAFRQQADAAVELIQAEHPWPTPPELSSEV